MPCSIDSGLEKPVLIRYALRQDALYSCSQSTIWCYMQYFISCFTNLLQTYCSTLRNSSTQVLYSILQFVLQLTKAKRHYCKKKPESLMKAAHKSPTMAMLHNFESVQTVERIWK